MNKLSVLLVTISKQTLGCNEGVTKYNRTNLTRRLTIILDNKGFNPVGKGFAGWK